MLLICLSISTVAMIGASRFYDPFSGDQALFLTGALSLKHGAILYRDFWDIKQPGIFVFYLLGAMLFGVGQLAEHKMDLLWQMIFAAVLIFSLSKCFTNKSCAAVTSLTVVASYFAGSSSYHLIQVEALVGLPIFGFAWLFKASLTRSENFLLLAILAGASAGIAVLFKSLFLVIVVTVALGVLFTTRPMEWRTARPKAFSCIAGFFIPMTLFVAYAALNGSLKETYEATFTLPQVIYSTIPQAPIVRLGDSALRFLLYFRGIIVLSIFGLLESRHANRSWIVICLCWAVSAIAVILVQKQSWWQYHFLLLVPPIGILAAFGVNSLVSRIKCSRQGLWALLVCGAVAYIAVPLPQGAIGTIRKVLDEHPYASPQNLLSYRREASDEYALTSNDAAATHIDSGKSIFVIGDPLIYVLLDRIQPIAMNGWAYRIYPEALWLRLGDELISERPYYIFIVYDVDGQALSAKAPRLLQLLSSDYETVAKTKDGTWYSRKTNSF